MKCRVCLQRKYFFRRDSLEVKFLECVDSVVEVVDLGLSKLDS